MAILTKGALLSASDITEREVELPSIGGSVKIRSLPAAYSNDATSSALEMTTINGEQTAHVNTTKLEALQVFHALVEPKLDTLAEADAFQQQCGPAWHTLVRAINEISGIDQEAIKRTADTFRVGGSEAAAGAAESNGVSAGDERPDIHVSAGA